MNTDNTLTLETTKGPVVIAMKPGTRRPATSPTSAASCRRGSTTASCFTG